MTSSLQQSAAPGDGLARERSRMKMGTRANKHTPMAERLAAGTAVDPVTGCHNWTKTLTTAGYGQVSTGTKVKKRPAHRASYELHKGPIPDGMQIDHLCRNPRCINPDHLEAVTPQENTLRGMAPNAIAVRNGACTKGHPYVEGSHYVHPKTGHRSCRICNPHRRGTPRPKLTAAMRDEALKRAKSGETQRHIAKLMGISGASVGKLLHQAGFYGAEAASRPFNERARRGPPVGEASTRSKLTDEQVLAIRSSTESNRKAAVRFGVTPSTVSDIRNGRYWQHLLTPVLPSNLDRNPK